MFNKDVRRAATQSVRDDSGFTIVEIMMAVVILLIALTGVMSLMMANTYMNVSAKEKSSLINEANSYIERVRQMNYNDIGTSSSTPAGALAPYTVTANGYVITVTPTVSAMTDDRIVNSSNVPIVGVLKKLTIVITAHRVGTTGPVVTYSTEAIIKKTDSGVNVAAQLPDIAPTQVSPSADDVVYGTAVPLGAIAHANGDGVTLSSINFYCDGVPMVGQGGSLAQWPLTTVSYTTSGFLWDTTAVNEDGIALSADGWHTIKLEAWDSNGRQAWYQFAVVVDNSPPVWPTDGWITAAPVNSTSMNLAWSSVYDGNAPVHHYELTTEKWGLQGSTYTWGTPVSRDFSTASGVAVAEPFTRYRYTVAAVGPPALNRKSSGSSSIEAVSRPEILPTSTWRNDGTNKTITTYVTIKLSPATFQVPGGTRSTLYKSLSPDMSSASVVGAPFTGWAPAEFTVATIEGNGWPDATQYYYQVVTAYSATYGGTKFYSQIVGPNGASNAAATAFTTKGW